MRRLASFGMIWLLLCSCAWAHPGHGSTDPTSVAHAFEAVHLLPVVGVIGGILTVLFCVRAGRSKRR